MIKIGLTGGMGSGKSTVAAYIEMIGYPVYYSDAQAKKLMTFNADLIKQIKATFGPSIFSFGTLDRKMLANIVFTSADKLKRLNEIVHPFVKADFIQWMQQQKSKAVFLESAILFESNFYLLMDKTIVITAPIEERIQRIEQRDHLKQEEILNRLQYQLPEKQLLKLADFHIANDHAHAVIPQVNKIMQTVLPI
ncbi:MAG: dephospho-CoA kinase [Microbacter sp.]